MCAAQLVHPVRAALQARAAGAAAQPHRRHRAPDPVDLGRHAGRCGQGALALLPVQVSASRSRAPPSAGGPAPARPPDTLIQGDTWQMELYIGLVARPARCAGLCVALPLFLLLR